MVPKLTNKAFWDADMNKIDYDRDREAVILKVFNDGTWNDILEVWNCYGKEVVVETLLSANYLKKAAVNLSSMMFTIDPKRYKCYSKIQSQRTL